MIKKISYIFVLFISLFMISIIVEAKVKCEIYGEGIVYEFDDSGLPISSTISGKSGGLDDTIFVEYSPLSDRIIVKDGKPVCPTLNTYYYNAKDDSGKPILKYMDYSISIDNAGGVAGCSELKTQSSCISDKKYSCLWVERETGKIVTSGDVPYSQAYCNVDNLQYVQCGNAFDIPVYAPRIISFVINLLKILTPIILVFTSAITLLKAITANKEDDMNKAKTTLVKRIGIAALIFFTITITQFVINKVADDGEPEELSSCFDCFINNKCEVNKYYKNNINGEYKCFYTDDVDGNKVFKGECH